MEQGNKVILLAGPTASGKSELALQLAKNLNGEIINADSMQIYKEIFILTSRPTTNNTESIRHHLYGFNSVKKKFSTGLWLKLVVKKIKDIQNNHRTPIIVGGTGLYFKALTDGLVEIPNIPTNIRNKIKALHKKIGQKKFYNKLLRLDPIVKNKISPTDTQRTIRAYEVKKFTNQSLFIFMKDTKSKFNKQDFKKLFISIPKELLHKKINQRVEYMFETGAIKEVKNFLKLKINKDLSPNKIIGINEIKDYLKGKATLNETKELISQKTRQYAKRQFTWSRGHMKSWNMIYSSDLNDLFKKAINKIS